MKNIQLKFITFIIIIIMAIIAAIPWCVFTDFSLMTIKQRRGERSPDKETDLPLGC